MQCNILKFPCFLIISSYFVSSTKYWILKSFNRRCPHYHPRWSHSLNSLDLDSWLIQPTLHCPETTWVHLGIFHSLPGPGLIISESTTNIWRFAWVHTLLPWSSLPGWPLLHTLQCLQCFSDISNRSQSHWKPSKWFKSPVSPPSCQT